jgi:hypothetical protein
MLQKALIALILAVTCTLSSAQAPNVSIPRESRASAAPTSTASALPAEAIAIREQNKIIREYHSSLLDTVYWALGGVFALAALLSGFGWWSNFRVYEADKKRLREELDGQLKEAESKAALREKDAQQAADAKLEAKIENAFSRMLNELTEVRRETGALRTKLSTSIESASKPLRSAVDRVTKLERGLAEREAELRHVEEYVWDLKSNDTNVLLTQGQGVSAAALAQNKYYLDNVLKRMKATIEQKVLPKNVELSQTVIDLLKQRLDSAAEQNPTAVAELLGLVAKINAKP